MFSKLLTAKQQHKYLTLFPSLQTLHNIKQQLPTNLNLFATIIYCSIKKYNVIQSLKHQIVDNSKTLKAYILSFKHVGDYVID